MSELDRAEPLKVACPYCEACAGEQCQDPPTHRGVKKRHRWFHTSRKLWAVGETWASYNAKQLKSAPPLPMDLTDFFGA